MDERCIVIGGGGHAKVVLDAVLTSGKYTPVGVLDRDVTLWNTLVCGVRVLGGDELLKQLFDQGIRNVMIGLGGVSNNQPRKTLAELVSKQGFEVIGVVHPTASISKFSEIHLSAQIFDGVHIGPAVQLHEGVIINTHALIEHDCEVAAFAHVASGAVLGGEVQVGSMAHIGSGATVRQKIKIGVGAVIGAGAVVVRDVEDGDVVVGVPAKSLLRS